VLETQADIDAARQAPGVKHVVPIVGNGDPDVFLEALEIARVADVLVVDNDGRLDGACVGDLVTLEVQKMASSA
jgi:regulator of RNase E activity RraA